MKNVNVWNVLIIVYNKFGFMEKFEWVVKKVLEIDLKYICVLINLVGWYIDLGCYDEGVIIF